MDNSTILIVIIALATIGLSVALFFATRGWTIFDSIMAFLTFIAAGAFCFLGAATLRTHDAWRDQYNRLEAAVAVAKARRERLETGVARDPEGRLRPLAEDPAAPRVENVIAPNKLFNEDAIEAELSKSRRELKEKLNLLLAERGRVWRRMEKTGSYSEPTVAVPTPAAEPTDQPAEGEEPVAGEPAVDAGEPAVPQPHHLANQMVLYAFRETRDGAGELTGLTYRGEYVVETTTETTATLKLTEQPDAPGEAPAGATGAETWTLYEVMPIDVPGMPLVPPLDADDKTQDRFVGPNPLGPLTREQLEASLPIPDDSPDSLKEVRTKLIDSLLQHGKATETDLQNWVVVELKEKVEVRPDLVAAGDQAGYTEADPNLTKRLNELLDQRVAALTARVAALEAYLAAFSGPFSSYVGEQGVAASAVNTLRSRQTEAAQHLTPAETAVLEALTKSLDELSQKSGLDPAAAGEARRRQASVEALLSQTKTELGLRQAFGAFWKRWPQVKGVLLGPPNPDAPMLELLPGDEIIIPESLAQQWKNEAGDEEGAEPSKFKVVAKVHIYPPKDFAQIFREAAKRAVLVRAYASAVQDATAAARTAKESFQADLVDETAERDKFQADADMVARELEVLKQLVANLTTQRDKLLANRAAWKRHNLVKAQELFEKQRDLYRRAASTAAASDEE